MTKIEAKVLVKRIEVVSTHKQSNRYGLTFEVDNYQDKIGIYLGTKDQSSGNQIFNRIDTNKIYAFFIDPTVSAENGINLGIRQIKLNDINIYTESNNPNLFLGISFILLSVSGFLLIDKFKRKKRQLT